MTQKHIKLFEQFTGSGENPMIVIKGYDIEYNDYGSGSATYVVDYYSSPSADEAEGALYEDEPASLEDIFMDGLGGDQNGLYVSNGEVKMMVDPSISPREMEYELEEHIERLGLGSSLIFNIV
jgi:hypothetical protein